MKLINYYLLLAMLAVASSGFHSNHKAVQFQGEHFFSETEKSASYTLKKLASKQPLVVTLKNKNDQDEQFDQPVQPPITVSISEDGTLKRNCTFHRMDDLCSVDSVTSPTNTIVKVACSALPCDVIFEAFQPPSSQLELDREVTAENLHLFNVGQENLVMELMSNYTKISSIADEVRLYSSADYEAYDDGQMLIVVFKEKMDSFFLEGDPRMLKHIVIKTSRNADSLDIGKEARFIPQGSREVQLNKLPEKQLRLEMSINSLREVPLKVFTVEFFGYNGKENKTSLAKFEIEPEGTQPNSDVNIILKHAQFSKYEHVNFTVTSKQQIIVTVRANDTDIHEIEADEESYFELEKGQTISYKIVAEPSSDEKLEIFAGVITEGAEGKIDLKLSEKPCLYFKGCNLQITSKDDLQAGIMVSLDSKLVSEVKYIPLEKSLTFEMRQGDRKHLLFNSTTAKDRVLSVSTSNLLVYASVDEKCKVPSQKCADYFGNAEDPIVLENQTGPVYITIKSLELVKATIRIDEKNNAFALEDGIPLTYSMEKAKNVFFTFHIPAKKSVNFNLVAPLNSFVMSVANSKEKPDTEDVDLQSSSSFIKYDQENIDGLDFTVLVKRVTLKTNENFVLIASTKDSVITLDRSEPHQDILEPSIPRYFAVLMDFQEIESGVNILLNLHIFQQASGINMSVRASQNIKKFESETMSITKTPQLIPLTKFAEAICDNEPEEATACHVFLEFTNHGSHSLDITLSIIGNNSILQLRSGIWQSFALTQLTSQNHFTFTPTNKRYPINLQFSHSYGEFRLAYTLWNNKVKQTNSAEWPFPNAETMPDLTFGLFQGNDYTIPPEEIEKCYPDCILLISLWGENKIGSSLFGSYRIMATDDMIELAEEHKLPITLAVNETKSLLIDLQHYIETQKTLTIMSSSLLGFHECFGGLVTSRDMKMPSDHSFDYRLDTDETQLTMAEIKQKVESKKQSVKDGVKLALYCKSFEASRFTLEFTTSENYIQKLLVGQPQQIIIAPHAEKYIQTEHYMDYRVKVTRTQGYPQISYRACQRKEMEDCYQKLSAEPTDKATDKVIEIREKWCAGCMLLIRVVAGDEKLVFDAVALSQFTAVELKEGMVATDIVSANSSNLYKLQAVRNQTITVTVTVFEGNLTMRVFNYLENLDRNGTKHGNILSVVVGAADFHTTQPGENHDKPMLTNFAFSQSFSELMVEVRSPDHNGSYSISYSVGERSLVLQDGVLSSAIIKKNETVIFNYRNYGHGMNSIVSVSFTDSEMLDGCQIQISQSIGNEQPVVHSPDKLATKKKLPRPTITFHLSDAYSQYEIIIKNTKPKDAELNIIINHQDIILLPYGYEYSSTVGKNESEDLIVWVSNEGYVEFHVRKCSQSDLTFSYALDDDAYQKGEFNYQTAVEQHYYTAFVKAHVGSIYVRLTSLEGSLYSIEATGYHDKRDVPNSDIKPGNKGLIEYTTISDKQVEVVFTPIQCKGQCPNATYYFLLHSNQENVVNQIACPGSFFLFQNNEVLAPTTIHPEKASDKRLKFKLDISKEIQFLGLKAIIDGTHEVPYPVIEIATFWGGVQKSRHWLFIASGLLVLGVLLCVLAVFRRRNRMKYQQLPEAFDSSV